MIAEVLTPAGRQWALTHRDDSIARVALAAADGWPLSHVDAAIRVCNKNGASS